MKHDLPERVYNMDLVNSSGSLVVALAGRTVEVYDVRKMGEAKQKRESSLKFMTKSLAAMPDGQGALTCSVLSMSDSDVIGLCRIRYRVRGRTDSFGIL